MSIVSVPTVEVTSDDNIVLTWTDSERKFHRYCDLPARIILTNKGVLVRQEWFIHGQRHAETHPAIISYVNGIAREHEWFLWSKPGRKLDGPTYEKYSAEGDIVGQRWYDANGQPHRIDGPAEVDYLKDRECYWLDGTQMPLSRWEKERKAYLVHKMTIEEIEQALGKKIEIVGYVKADI